MTRQWRRRPADWREMVGAALLGAGVGLAAFYMTRLLLARDVLDPLPDTSPGETTRESSGES